MLFANTRTSQPQTPVGIDWGNPLARGLTSCLVFINGSIIDVLKNRVLLSSSNLVQKATRSGIGLKPTTPAGQTLAGYFQNVTAFTRVFVATPQITGTGAISDSSTSSQGAEIQITPSNILLNRAAVVNYISFPISGTVPVSAAVICSPTRQIICVNGRAGTPRVGAVSFSALGSGTLFAGSTSSEKFDGTLLLHFDYNRALSDAEGVAISANPWQIFAPESRQIWVPSSSATNYTLTADAGVYALSGQTAEITRSRLIDGAAGSYSLTGQDATIAYTPVSGYVIDCEAGSYSLTGQSADIEYVGSTRNGGAPAWNPYATRGETEEQKRTRRLAQGIIKQAQKPSADVEKLSVKAKQISEKLQRDANAYELEAEQLSIELAKAYDARLKAAAMNALNDALATRQLEQQLVIAQVHAEMVRQQIEELDVVFMAVMLSAM